MAHYKLNSGGFCLDSMRLDRLDRMEPDEPELQAYMDGLSHGIKAGTTLAPGAEENGCLVSPFFDSLASFQRVWGFVQAQTDVTKIVVSPDRRVFSGSSLKELNLSGEVAGAPLAPLAKPTPTLQQSGPFSREPSAVSSAAGSPLIPIVEKTVLSNIGALKDLATQQGPDGASARDSLERIKKTLNAATRMVPRKK